MALNFFKARKRTVADIEDLLARCEEEVSGLVAQIVRHEEAIEASSLARWEGAANLLPPADLIAKRDLAKSQLADAERSRGTLHQELSRLKAEEAAARRKEKIGRQEGAAEEMFIAWGRAQVHLRAFAEQMLLAEDRRMVVVALQAELGAPLDAVNSDHSPIGRAGTKGTLNEFLATLGLCEILHIASNPYRPLVPDLEAAIRVNWAPYIVRS